MRNIFLYITFVSQIFFQSPLDSKLNIKNIDMLHDMDDIESIADGCVSDDLSKCARIKEIIEFSIKNCDGTVSIKRCNTVSLFLRNKGLSEFKGIIQYVEFGCIRGDFDSCEGLFDAVMSVGETISPQDRRTLLTRACRNGQGAAGACGALENEPRIVETGPATQPPKIITPAPIPELLKAVIAAEERDRAKSHEIDRPKRKFDLEMELKIEKMYDEALSDMINAYGENLDSENIQNTRSNLLRIHGILIEHRRGIWKDILGQ